MMGFSYERAVDCMLEDYGHRTESIMTHVYGSWNSTPQHNWDWFTQFERIGPGRATCGNMHWAPNNLYSGGQWEYLVNGTNQVLSYCDDWLYNWPELKGTQKWVSCSEWGGCSGDRRAYINWWFNHLPRKVGINTDGKRNNWWKYTADFNNYAESQ
jgi:hypothetical protein